MFDVFLSGAADAREFLVFRLWSTCLLRGISTCLSEDKSKQRELSFSSEFSDPRKNIGGSKIAVVVVSEGYPTSAWCLNELQTILRFHDHGGLIVLPIFYKVNYSEIKSQIGKFEEPFRELRLTNPEKVQAWTIALTKLANIPGLDLHDLSDEWEMVEIITAKVRAMLFDWSKGRELVGLDRHMKALYKLLDLNKPEVRLIGIWGQEGVGKTTLARFAYEDLYSNFQTHMFIENAENIYYQDPVTSQSEETLTSGVHERTGRQVSTTAIDSTAVEGTQDKPKEQASTTAIESTAVEGIESPVGEGTQNKPEGQVSTTAIESTIEERTLNKPKGQASTIATKSVFAEWTLNMPKGQASTTAIKSTVGEGTLNKPKGQASTIAIKPTVGEGTPNMPKGQISTMVIKSTVVHRKSLLVIDCLDNVEQLKTVAEIVGWCGSGSRVILITPDKKLLDLFGAERVYEVKPLRYDEALQLFSISAFDREYPPASFGSLSLRAVQIARFLPLTLKILGSFLQNKNEEEWEKELQKLEGDREKTIMKILKKTYKREDEIGQTYEGEDEIGQTYESEDEIDQTYKKI